jgi:hypothetical protein
LRALRGIASCANGLQRSGSRLPPASGSAAIFAELRLDDGARRDLLESPRFPRPSRSRRSPPPRDPARPEGDWPRSSRCTVQLSSRKTSRDRRRAHERLTYVPSSVRGEEDGRRGPRHEHVELDRRDG